MLRCAQAEPHDARPRAGCARGALRWPQSSSETSCAQATRELRRGAAVLVLAEVAYSSVPPEPNALELGHHVGRCLTLGWAAATPLPGAVPPIAAAVLHVGWAPATNLAQMVGAGALMLGAMQTLGPPSGERLAIGSPRPCPHLPV